ncbi:sugar phosphate isomerase/epimerase [Octadecabacter sp. 1_MG-2023]|uniref:sugar phosphate isomerase/epimerase family protein n=1 Tax=unclassified Octadecabacter TaxID=196158 RepID=UPI001C080F7D|nr:MULTISPECIES: sugar phosphate isomerase/epimerase [unclassified Octadecabacter]MBU2994789.1 sugar phosphate isomerase/epimerase [Octadecabacter sp. B2R22]MDO6733917.1 sugar phosphate isomerase/epimerase [Octadecabacter sp. 1_MG-2023]
MTPALQLYSMRDCEDQIALLAQLPALGITSVEGYGGVYGDPVAYRAAMDANGISMASGHFGLEDIEADFDAAMKIVETLGITRVFAPYLEEKDRPDTAAGWAALGKRLNTAGQKFADIGITFGWHNHDFEFFALADGSIPMDVLLDAAPDISWEADLAWIVRGDRDPLDYIARYGNRLSAIHVKDIAAAGENLDQDGWADLGTGTIDWAALLQACRSSSGDLIYALEHDKPSDPVGYATRSAAAFKTLWENTHD